MEALLSLKLPYNLVKLYGPHLTCKFYLLLCKTYVQIATCLPCLPNLQEFELVKLNSLFLKWWIILKFEFFFLRGTHLAQFHKNFALINPGSLSAAKMAFNSGLSSGKKNSPGY